MTIENTPQTHNSNIPTSPTTTTPANQGIFQIPSETKDLEFRKTPNKLRSWIVEDSCDTNLDYRGAFDVSTLVYFDPREEAYEGSVDPFEDQVDELLRDTPLDTPVGTPLDTPIDTPVNTRDTPVELLEPIPDTPVSLFDTPVDEVVVPTPVGPPTPIVPPQSEPPSSPTTLDTISGLNTQTIVDILDHFDESGENENTFEYQHAYERGNTTQITAYWDDPNNPSYQVQFNLGEVQITPAVQAILHRPSVTFTNRTYLGRIDPH